MIQIKEINVLKVCFIVFFLVIIYSNSASAIDESQKLNQVLAELDRLENKLKQDADRLEKKVNYNEAKLRESEKSYSEILEIQKKSETILAEANKHLSNLESLQSKIQDVRERLTKTETNVKNIADQLSETKAEVKSSGNVIKWVTAIVSIIVIIIGLFFSKVFLDLYANYKVLKAKFGSEESERVEAEGQEG